MNELTNAVTYFEDAIRESNEIIDECSPKLQMQLVEQKQHFAIALEAMREKAERDQMQCINCRLKDTELCRAVWKTKYDIKKEKWKCKTMMEDDGFCSRFYPKEPCKGHETGKNFGA